ncbi:MAG: hypothetical protein SGPRY_013100, partial [Prymnesium sp.]
SLAWLVRQLEADAEALEGRVHTAVTELDVLKGSVFNIDSSVSDLQSSSGDMKRLVERATELAQHHESLENRTNFHAAQHTKHISAAAAAIAALNVDVGHVKAALDQHLSTAAAERTTSLTSLPDLKSSDSPPPPSPPSLAKAIGSVSSLTQVVQALSSSNASITQPPPQAPPSAPSAPKPDTTPAVAQSSAFKHPGTFHVQLATSPPAVAPPAAIFGAHTSEAEIACTQPGCGEDDAAQGAMRRPMVEAPPPEAMEAKMVGSFNPPSINGQEGAGGIDTSSPPQSTEAVSSMTSAVSGADVKAETQVAAEEAVEEDHTVAKTDGDGVVETRATKEGEEEPQAKDEEAAAAESEGDGQNDGGAEEEKEEAGEEGKEGANEEVKEGVGEEGKDASEESKDVSEESKDASEENKEGAGEDINQEAEDEAKEAGDEEAVAMEGKEEVVDEATSHGKEQEDANRKAADDGTAVHTLTSSVHPMEGAAAALES